MAIDAAPALGLPRGLPKRANGLTFITDGTIRISLSGTAQFRQAFSAGNIEKKVVNKIVKQAVTDASVLLMKRMREIAKTRAGEGLTTTGHKRQHLWQTINKRVRTYSKGRGKNRKSVVVGIIGPTSKASGGMPHRHLVIGGTNPHYISSETKWMVYTNSRGFKSVVPPGVSVLHPGAMPFNFVRMAAVEMKPRLNQVITRTISAHLAAALKS